MVRGVVSWGVLGVGDGVTGVAGCLVEAIFLFVGISSSVETDRAHVNTHRLDLHVVTCAVYYNYGVFCI